MADEKEKPKSDSGSSGGEKKPSSTTHKTEQPVMVDTTGVDIRKLLSSATGKEFEDLTSKDFEDFAASKGVVKKDIRRMSKAFDSVKKNSMRQFLIDTDGFNVLEENLPLTRSGRDIGNKKGLDIGDLVGAGRDVSLLAGFASRELSNYRQEKERKALETAGAPSTEALKEGAKPSGSLPKPAPNGSSLLKRPTTGKPAAKPTSTAKAPPKDNMVMLPDGEEVEDYESLWKSPFKPIGGGAASQSAKTQKKSGGKPTANTFGEQLEQGFVDPFREIFGGEGKYAKKPITSTKEISEFFSGPSEEERKKNRQSIEAGWNSVKDFFSGPEKKPKTSKSAPKSTTKKASLEVETNESAELSDDIINALREFMRPSKDDMLEKRAADSVKTVKKGKSFNSRAWDEQMRRGNYK